MEDTTKLKADTIRGRKYVFWKFVRKAVIVIGLLSGVVSIVWAFIGVGSIFFDTGLSQEVLVAVSPFAAGVTFWSIALYNSAKNAGAKYVDTRFSHPSYDLFLKSLQQRGVKRPMTFIRNNPEHVTAYKKVLKTAYEKIDNPAHKETVLSALNVWSLSPKLIEEHKVAALVLPGAEELNRLPRIENLINNRGIRTYPEIKGLIEQNDEVPSALADGSL
jgi:hypothetical protein